MRLHFDPDPTTSPLHTFGLLIARTADDLASVSFVAEWVGPGDRGVGVSRGWHHDAGVARSRLLPPCGTALDGHPGCAPRCRGAIRRGAPLPQRAHRPVSLPVPRTLVPGRLVPERSADAADLLRRPVSDACERFLLLRRQTGLAGGTATVTLGPVLVGRDLDSAGESLTTQRVRDSEFVVDCEDVPLARSSGRPAKQTNPLGHRSRSYTEWFERRDQVDSRIMRSSTRKRSGAI